MNNNIKKIDVFLCLILLVGLLMAACNQMKHTDELPDLNNVVTETVTAAEIDAKTNAPTPTGVSDRPLLGVAAAAQDNSLEVASMLRYALEDEYLARDAYTKIMDAFGEIRPFINIRETENNHIDMLIPLFTVYELPLPEYETDPSPFASTLADAYATGVQAEIDNIAMYERFLDEDLPNDVRVIFERLMKASQKHLRAFERGL